MAAALYFRADLVLVKVEDGTGSLVLNKAVQGTENFFCIFRVMGLMYKFLLRSG